MCNGNEILEGIGWNRNVGWEVFVSGNICVWMALSNRSVVKPFSQTFHNSFFLLVMKSQVHCIPRPFVHVVQDDKWNLTMIEFLFLLLSSLCKRFYLRWCAVTVRLSW